MKGFFAFLLSVCLCSGLCACAPSSDAGTPSAPPATPPAAASGEILVAFFSCTGTTKGVAGIIAEETGGTLHEIVPAEPYTEEDLAYYTGGRADREQADPDARPEIANSVENTEDYDTVFLGYPIWHGQAPKIIYTFLESYDFSGKTIIPFCTSHSSGIGSSDDNLHPLAPDAEWRDGRRFSGNEDAQTISQWLEEFDLDLKNDVSSFDLESGENGRAPM